MNPSESHADGQLDDTVKASAGGVLAERELLSHTPAARVLGVSPSQLRRYARTGVVEPAMIDERGQRYFDEAILLEKRLVLRGEARPAPKEVEDTELAVAAFGLFETGVAPVDVVLRLRASPKKIQSLFATWRAMRDEHRRSLEQDRRHAGGDQPTPVNGKPNVSPVGDERRVGTDAWFAFRERNGFPGTLTLVKRALRAGQLDPETLSEKSLQWLARWLSRDQIHELAAEASDATEPDRNDDG